MADWASLLRPELADLTAYVPARHDGLRAKLDANEAPPNRVVARAAAGTPLERYPDATAAELKDAIAERTGVRPADPLVGTGSDEVIALLVTALARPRERAAQAGRMANRVRVSIGTAVENDAFLDALRGAGAA